MNLAYTGNGDYLFPDLTIEDLPVSYGKYGILRRTFLKEHKRGWYQSLLLRGRLDSHLQEIDDAANARLSEIVSQMAKAGGITEGLKASDPMGWISRMNSIRNSAKEIILDELIYT